MMLLYTLLLALPFAYSHHGESCNFDDKLMKPRNMYYSCLWLSRTTDVASCLLQVNSLEGTMFCANWDTNRALYFHLNDQRARMNDHADIVPFETTDGVTHWEHVNDGILKFTPRGLILAASYACAEEGECDRQLYSRVKLCPYEDMKTFLPCLKCQGVKSGDIERFDIYIRGKKFGPGNYGVPGDLMDWNGRMRRGVCWDGSGDHFELFDVSSPLSLLTISSNKS